ncbi:flagellar hook-associated protein FlgK [Aquabacter sp. L1I39]|uniref:flagellar hook-associated protein FlgK n=1 Tax=Aquabacter sp. L1I39 TaxID=2820278 RepID=UPI001ADA395E|nr:flagellar hook-associated protein FlgK [Aquabacter sp. L1I39]QTL04310.1 flagellar hook-associated protein FlgK [Aquabacter sp. L1I39]
MSLSLAFNTARSSLNTTASQLSVSSRNVAGANDPNASRKIALTVTSGDGSSRVVTISRATGGPLFDRMLGATSNTAQQRAVLDGLDTLKQTIGDTNSTTSPAARLGVLQSALQSAANAPDDPGFAQTVVTAATDLARSLNSATDTVQQARTDADAGIGTSVTKVNDLLAQFEVENATVVSGSARGVDVTDAMDRRDAILSSLSQEMGISTVSRGHNDVVIYTDSGATLFDTVPRAVTFRPSTVLDATTDGQAVFVDGVAVTGTDAAMPLLSGRIAGLATLRDTLAPTYQNQLDELARGLVSAFSEQDQTGGGAPAAAGLFTVGDGTATVPASLTAGLAGTLAVHSGADAAQGGDPFVLRDGGLNGAAYGYNTASASSFQQRLEDLGTGLATARTYDSASGLGATPKPLSGFASASVSWLEGLRQTTSTRADSEQAVLSQASTAMSNATGINLDQEYANQLELERSYQASSKLIGVVNQLFDTLFSAIR